LDYIARLVVLRLVVSKQKCRNWVRCKKTRFPKTEREREERNRKQMRENSRKETQGERGWCRERDAHVSRDIYIKRHTQTGTPVHPQQPEDQTWQQSLLGEHPWNQRQFWPLLQLAILLLIAVTEFRSWKTCNS
jgi:hypothetical protein